MNKHISTKILSIIILMLLFSVANAFVTLLFQRKMTQDAVIVNIAGRQRMLSQKMTKLALLIEDGSDNKRVELKEAANLYNRSLVILTKGSESKKNPAGS